MNRYIRHGIVPAEIVLPLVKEHYGNNLPKPVFHGHPVGVTSLRMKTFQHDGLVCRGCGLTASYFAVEDFHNARHPQPHLNLYGINADGAEVLFTHDHKLARGLGGADNLSNVQTMCFPCNNKKSRTENPQINKSLKPVSNPAPESEFYFGKPKPDLESGIAIQNNKASAKTE